MNQKVAVITSAGSGSGNSKGDPRVYEGYQAHLTHVHKEF